MDLFRFYIQLNKSKSIKLSQSVCEILFFQTSTNFQALMVKELDKRIKITEYTLK